MLSSFGQNKVQNINEKDNDQAKGNIGVAHNIIIVGLVSVDKITDSINETE